MNRPLTTETAIERGKRWKVSLRPMPYDLCPILKLVLLLLSLFVALSPTPASGQTKRTFTPRISVQEQYDDNIDLTRNNKKSDWITTVGPGFNLGIDSEHTKLSLDCSGGYSFYAKDSSGDTTVLGSTLSLDQQLSSRLSVKLSDALVRTEDPITTENGVVTDVSRQRRVQYRNTGEAGLSYQFGPENRATVGYRNRLLESRSDQDEDSLGNEGFFTLATWFGRRFGTELTGGVTRGAFDQPNDFTGTPTEDFYNYDGGITLNYRWEPSRRIYTRYQILDHRFDQTSKETDTQDYLIHQGTLGTSLALGPYTTFDADGGYWFQDVDGGRNRDGFAFNTALSTRQERLTLRVGGSGGYDESYFTSENLGFSKYYQAFGNADYQLTQALALFAFGSYRWQEYYDTGDEETDRTDKTWQTTAGFRCSFLRYLTLSLDGTHTERSSDDLDEEFTDNRVTARLTWAYSVPF